VNIKSYKISSPAVIPACAFFASRLVGIFGRNLSLIRVPFSKNHKSVCKVLIKNPRQSIQSVAIRVPFIKHSDSEFLQWKSVTIKKNQCAKFL